MSDATRAFVAQLALALFATFSLVAATTELFLAHVSAREVGGVVGWCVRVPSGSPSVDEVVLVCLVMVLSAVVGRATSSTTRQLRSTSGLRHSVGCRPVRRQLRRTRRLCHRLELLERVDVVPSKHCFAFCHGLLRPRVVLSLGLIRLLEDRELEAVLLHERYHLSHHDPLKGFVTQTLEHGVFFLPTVAELGRYYCLRRELAADEAAIAVQGDGYPLAAALYKLLSRPDFSPYEPRAAAGFTSTVDARIDHLLGSPVSGRFRPSPRAAVASLAALLLVTGLALSPGLAGAHVHDLIARLACVA